MDTNKEPWFSVKCLFSHPTRTKDGDGNLYEERVTLWKCKSWEEAFNLAKEDAEQYAKEENCVFIDTTDAFHLFEKEINHGSEVWSLMRGSHLEPDTYIDTFCYTERDRTGIFNSETKENEVAEQSNTGNSLDAQ